MSGAAAPDAQQPGLAWPPGHVVVVGGANLDIKARATFPVIPGTSIPGRVDLTPGGVARNIAEGLARLGEAPILIAAMANDIPGQMLQAHCNAAGIGCRHVACVGATGLYAAMLDAAGDLLHGVAAMDATACIDGEAIARHSDAFAQAGAVVADANLEPATLVLLAQITRDRCIPFVVDPVSVPKCGRIAGVLDAGLPVALMTPNRAELSALTGIDTVDENGLYRASAALRARGVARVMVGLGAEGVVFVADDGCGVLPAMAEHGENQVMDAGEVTGAGDTALAAALWALRRGASMRQAALAGQYAAALTCRSMASVPEGLAERELATILGRPERTGKPE